MKQDMILILDLGSEENPKIAREIRALGVYTEINAHDISAAELSQLPNVKGIILNGGPNRVVDGVEIDKVLEVLICKNLFLCNRQKTNFYLLLMPGDKPFKTKELSSQINSARLSFASAEDMEKYLDIHPGAVSVMGLMNDHDNMVQLLVDEDVLKGEYMGCHPCVNTSSMKLKTADVFTTYLEAVHHKAITVVLKGE